MWKRVLNESPQGFPPLRVSSQKTPTLRYIFLASSASALERKIGAVSVLGLISAKSSAESVKWRRSSERLVTCRLKNVKSVDADSPMVTSANLKEW